MFIGRSSGSGGASFSGAAWPTCTGFGGRAFEGAGPFLAAGFAGMFIPGIACAKAGIGPTTDATALEAISHRINDMDADTKGVPKKRWRPANRRGVRAESQSAVAILAGAWIAAAAGSALTSTILLRFAILASGHLVSPFALLEASESSYSVRTMVQSQAIHSISIGKLAAAGGVGVETIRFYQRRGLLETPTREYGIRRYGSDDVRRLRFIKQAQAAGFTLEEIKELLDLDASEDRSRVRELANARVKSLDAKIAELGRARDALRRLARECGSGTGGPCPILASFES